MSRDIPTRGGRSGNKKPSRKMMNCLNVMNPIMLICSRGSPICWDSAHIYGESAITAGLGAGTLWLGKMLAGAIVQ